jgi:hypothetical protein
MSSGRFDLVDCMLDLRNHVTIHGDDVLAHSNWEISETWLRKYGFVYCTTSATSTLLTSGYLQVFGPTTNIKYLKSLETRTRRSWTTLSWHRPRWCDDFYLTYVPINNNVADDVDMLIISQLYIRPNLFEATRPWCWIAGRCTLDSRRVRISIKWKPTISSTNWLSGLREVHPASPSSGIGTSRIRKLLGPSISSNMNMCLLCTGQIHSWCPYPSRTPYICFWQLPVGCPWGKCSAAAELGGGFAAIKSGCVRHIDMPYGQPR